MAEYEKFGTHQENTAQIQESWQFDISEFEKQTHLALSSAQLRSEQKLIEKTGETTSLVDDLRQQEREFEEMKKQIQSDVDTEVLLVVSRYEKKLRIERDEGARLKGENGIMRKKFSTLSKDIEENKIEILRMKEAAKKLEGVIASLEIDIQVLRKEVICTLMSDVRSR